VDQYDFPSILEFTKLKEKCLFCEHPLRACLTNFIGLHKNGLPYLNATIDQARFSFLINHTTETIDVKAQGVIDIVTNKLVLTVPPDSNTPSIDQQVARQAFIELKPHIELRCYNKKCKNRYTLSSYILDAQKIPGIVAWQIAPVKLFLETFNTNRLIVQNDWIKKDTNIYSIINEESDPIKVPFMDFEAMGKDKLLTRISTLVTFS
jgi:hypothetical protein